MLGKLALQNSARKPLQRRLGLALLALLLSTLFVSLIGTASADNFSSPFFRRTWQRADYPVAIGATTRGYTWGPGPFFSSFEPYGQSPNGQRRVEYFDKARMEISYPTAVNPNNEYYVTNGLIVKEMVTGLLQVGDDSFQQRYPAYDVAVAGDPSEFNSEAPTYASFFALNSFYNTAPAPDPPPTDPSSGLLQLPLMDKQPDRINERAVFTLSKSGAVARNELLGSLEGMNIVYYERTLGHNIPKVFWDYLNQTGLVFDGSRLVFGQVFNWVSTMGYPISDAYWVRATVAGVPRDVLVQLYERRILTFTPTNIDPFKVEMGNVGRHYYSWRYNPLYDLSLPQQSAAEVKPEAGYPGITYSIKIFRFIQNEAIQTTIVTPDGRPFIGRVIVSSELPTGFTYWAIYVVTNASTTPGQYTIYFKGTQSGNEAKAYFFVIGIPGYNLPPR